MPGAPSYDFVYVHSDIPEGMTIRGWRAERAARAAALRATQRRARRERTRATFEALRRVLVEVRLRALPHVPPRRPVAGGSR